ncbi:hypothetical protein CCR75_002285 [Bremia lactucae]|uniref:Secreted RxLR effector protein n=1 Tax=Bremia lactucae TaxID=4779 RepID=A0A976FML6_BRELC|nr:hypothetical protein CCR75_002285 [Bremia lactucae]
MRFAFVWLVVMIVASVAGSDTTNSTRKALATKETVTSVVVTPSVPQRRRLGWSSKISEWSTKLGQNSFIQKLKAFFQKHWFFKPAKIVKPQPVDNPYFPRPFIPSGAQSTATVGKKFPVPEPGISTGTKLLSGVKKNEGERLPGRLETIFEDSVLRQRQ